MWSFNKRWKIYNPTRTAPNFILPKITDLEQAELYNFKQQHIMLTFLPGLWAPWARKLLSELENVRQQLDEERLHLVVVISQLHEQVEMYMKTHEVSYDIFVDEFGVISKRYGVFDEQLSEPMKISKPAIFVLNGEHQIELSFIGKHLADRPTADDFLDCLNYLKPTYEIKPNLGWKVLRFFHIAK